MSARIGVLKGHTQAVLCCEALPVEQLLVTGGEVNSSSAAPTAACLRQPGVAPNADPISA